MAFGLVAMISAQGEGTGRTTQRQPAAEAVTVSGSMVFAYGSPALKSGDVTYIVTGINRLIGFVDGFKEGAQVTIEGRSVSSPRDSNLKFLRPSKLTFSGKTYDMALPANPSGTIRPRLFMQTPPAPPSNRQPRNNMQRNNMPRNNMPQARPQRPNMRSM